MSSENFNITIVGNNNNSNLVLDSSNTQIVETSKTEIENNLIKKKCTCGEDVSPENCKIIEELYNNDVLGKSCCSDPSQPLCSALKALDPQQMKQYVYDAPNFDEALYRLEEAYTLWYGVKHRFRCVYYATILPAKALPILRDKNSVVSESMNNTIYKGVILDYNDPYSVALSDIFGNAREEFTRVTLQFNNFADGGTTTLTQTNIDIGNDGRIITLGTTPSGAYDNYYDDVFYIRTSSNPYGWNKAPLEELNQLTPEESSPGAIYGTSSYISLNLKTQSGSIIDHKYLISSIPESLRNAIQRADPELNIPDILDLSDVTVTDLTFSGNTGWMGLFTSNIIGPVVLWDSVKTRKGQDFFPITEDDVLLDTGGSLPEEMRPYIRSATRNKSEFKEIINLARTYVKFTPIKW